MQTQNDNQVENNVPEFQLGPTATSGTDEQYFQVTSPFVKPMHQIEVDDETEALNNNELPPE